jgi:energy-coupling factor transport system ATP-binding protein
MYTSLLLKFPGVPLKGIIEVKNLFFKYAKTDKYALRNISLVVNEGDFIIMTGHGGAGKTTLCLALTGLIPSYIPGEMEGSVKVFGKDTRSVEPHELSKEVGIVFQEPETQFFTSSVESDLAFPLENLMTPREEIRKRIDDILTIMRLEHYRTKPPYKLSGGQKQRVATAIGLVLRPKIMIYDEVTASLDPIGKYEVSETIKRLHDVYNITTIVVTHDIEEMIEHANRMIVLDKGELILDGPPKEVIKEGLDRGYGIRYPTLSEIGYFLIKKGIKTDIPLTLDDSTYELFKRYGKKVFMAAREKNKQYMQGASPIVDVKDVTFSYPGAMSPALEKVNLKIFPGEFLAIVGQNGSGKTTLMKLIAGLLKLTSGDIIIKGESIKNMTISKLCRLTGYVFQYPEDQIFCNTVFEEIAYGPRNLGLSEDEIKKLVDDLAEKLGITPILHSNPFFLSRPEKRIVTLASVLAMNPEILLLDEPTTGQDWYGSKRILEIAKTLNKEGKTIILVTHDMRLVCEYATRTVVMLNGKILMDGPTRDVFAKRDILTKAFIEVPQFVKLFQDLYGETVLTVEEAKKLIEDFM